MYCTTCKKQIEYNSTKKSKGVKRHIESKHQHLLDSYANTSKSAKKVQAELLTFFPTKAKYDSMKIIANEQHFNRLVALWTEASLRPFSILDDSKLPEIITVCTCIRRTYNCRQEIQISKTC